MHVMTALRSKAAGMGCRLFKRGRAGRAVHPLNMSVFSGHAKTWLGAPLHSSVLSYLSQTEHPRPTQRLPHTLTQPEAETWTRREERDNTGAWEDRKQEETRVKKRRRVNGKERRKERKRSKA